MAARPMQAESLALGTGQLLVTRTLVRETAKTRPEAPQQNDAGDCSCRHDYLLDWLKVKEYLAIGTCPPSAEYGLFCLVLAFSTR